MTKYVCFTRKRKEAIKYIKKLQKDDKENIYLCPTLVFSAINPCDMKAAEYNELCFDLMCLCDEVIVPPHITNCHNELELATKLHLEITKL